MQPAIIAAFAVLWPSSILACDICNDKVTLDEGRAACFIAELPTLQGYPDEPVFVNFIGCSEEVQLRGIANTIGPVESRIGLKELIEFDDVAFMSKASVDCLAQELTSRQVLLPGQFMLDCQ